MVFTQILKHLTVHCSNITYTITGADLKYFGKGAALWNLDPLLPISKPLADANNAKPADIL